MITDNRILAELATIAKHTARADKIHKRPRRDERLARISRGEFKSVIWNKEQIDRAMSPMVYIFWGRTKDNDGNKIALYIGVSIWGLGRPLSSNHHRKLIRDQASEMEFICCPSEEDATKLETRLIKIIRPLYNGALDHEEGGRNNR